MSLIDAAVVFGIHLHGIEPQSLPMRPKSTTEVVHHVPHNWN